MTIIVYTEQEAAKILRIEEVTLRNLRRRRKIGHYKDGTYSEQHLVDYKLSIEVKRCVENLDYQNSETKQEKEPLPSGTSHTLTDKEADVAQRAVKSARKTMKPKYSSRTSFSNENAHQLSQQMS